MGWGNRKIVAWACQCSILPIGFWSVTPRVTLHIESASLGASRVRREHDHPGTATFITAPITKSRVTTMPSRFEVALQHVRRHRVCMLGVGRHDPESGGVCGFAGHALASSAQCAFGSPYGPAPGRSRASFAVARSDLDACAGGLESARPAARHRASAWTVHGHAPHSVRCAIPTAARTSSWSCRTYGALRSRRTSHRLSRKVRRCFF